jgi:Na+/glutamate symporter
VLGCATVCLVGCVDGVCACTRVFKERREERRQKQKEKVDEQSDKRREKREATRDKIAPVGAWTVYVCVFQFCVEC